MKNGLVIQPRPVPLTPTEDGVLRVTGTRIPLERIVECYEAGLTPEAIVDSFDTLRIGDVYTVIGYYLDHKQEVAEYLRAREEKAEEVRRRIEATQPSRAGLREELLARWARREKQAAPADQ